jgi:hypothetical protein
MKKGRSDSGTLHLFEGVDVRRAPQGETPESICGVYEHEGTFTGVPDVSELGESLCSRCKRVVEGDDG